MKDIVLAPNVLAYSQFTCFTGTKLHILTLRAAAHSVEDIIHAPNVLAYSLDRMRLRHTFLRDKGLRLGLASMLSYSTSDFQKRFDHDGDLL